MAADRNPGQTMHTGDGVLESHGDGHALRFERRLRHPVRRVWSALTDPVQLAGWLAATELELVPGGRVEMRWLNTGNAEPATFTGAITRLDPPRLIEYELGEHGRLTWEIHADGDGSVLSFTCAVGIAGDQLLMNLAGWHVHLDYLAEALDGHVQDWTNWSDQGWRAIHDRYVKRYA